MSDLPTLIMMCGLPRSGKSTVARLISAQIGAPIVCPDEVRLALHGRAFEPKAEGFVWATTKVMVRALFGSGHSYVILDGCANERRHRAEWDRPGEWSCTVHRVKTPVAICRGRALEEGDDDLAHVIDRMALRHEPPDEIARLELAL